MSERDPRAIEDMAISDSASEIATEAVRGHAQALGLAGGDTPRVLDRGASVGRYLVLERVGSGGMGQVYAAYDPELDRRVALKILHSARGGQTAADRLQREAQAMARLSHPNVISVHDVGSFEGEVFVAMEFADGGSLGTWLREEPRSWREVLEVFLRAARGLAAAHAAGLIHRDFKPDNVLLGSDGRVLVADFGLARPAGDLGAAPTGPDADTPDAPDEESPEAAGRRLLSTPLTEAGAVMGTPAYMAPEQHLGEPTDARSDQFSFCVALYQALYGELPFAGRSVRDLREAVLRGEVRPPPPGSGIPAWLRRKLLRGLGPDRQERYPSMNALITQLDRGPLRSRRWPILVAAALVTAVTGGAIYAATRDADTCGGARSRLRGVWDISKKRQIEAAFLATGKPYARASSTGVAREIDRYSAAWAKMFRQACEATRRGEQSPTLLDLRMACLGRRLERVRALVNVLGEAAGDVVARAVTAAHALPPLGPCADAEALSARMKPPRDPALRPRLDAARRRLARVQAFHGAGQYRRAEILARSVDKEAKVLGYRPLEAEVSLALGRVLERTGDLKGAEAALWRAARAAEAGHHDRLVAEARINLVQVVGVRRQDHLRGREWGRDAAAGLERVGGNPVLTAALENNLGNVLHREARYVDATRHYRRALALRQRHLGRLHPEVAHTHGNLGISLRLAGKLDEATRHLTRSLEIAREVLGPAHPDVAIALNSLAPVYYRRGESARATQLFRQALAIQERALGPEHADVASTLNNLGLVLETQGHLGESVKYYERSLAIRRRVLGREHPDVAVSLSNLGVVFAALRRHGDAETLYREALAIQEKKVGRKHLLVGATLVNLGESLLALGRPREALPLFRRSLAIEEKALGSKHPAVAGPLTGLGEALSANGEATAAVAPLRRAVALLSQRRGDPAELARARFALARALGVRSPEARALASSARAAYSKLKGRYRDELERVNAWLARH